MGGFTQEVSVKDLARLAHAHGLPMMYDIGSGLLRRPKGLPLDDEPDVGCAIADGADIVAFSCDKLLGGPQAGILAGRHALIERMARAPMMRGLRVGKLTVAALSAACRCYLRDEDLVESNPTVALLERTPADLERLATALLGELRRRGVAAEKTDSAGRCGGGTLPDLQIRSLAVEVLPQSGMGNRKQTFAERLFRDLLQGDIPVLGVLREGRILFDVLAVFEEQIPRIAEAVGLVIEHESGICRTPGDGDSGHGRGRA
jgi:L-seryl-tRNA(Ser) seleniumtransferase